MGLTTAYIASLIPTIHKGSQDLANLRIPLAAIPLKPTDNNNRKGSNRPLPSTFPSTSALKAPLLISATSTKSTSSTTPAPNPEDTGSASDAVAPRAVSPNACIETWTRHDSSTTTLQTVSRPISSTSTSRTSTTPHRITTKTHRPNRSRHHARLDQPNGTRFQLRAEPCRHSHAARQHPLRPRQHVLKQIAAACVPRSSTRLSTPPGRGSLQRTLLRTPESHARIQPARPRH